MNLAFVTQAGAYDIRNYSGITTFMLNKMKPHYENVQVIEYLEKNINPLIRATRPLSQKFLGFKFDYNYLSMVGRKYANVIEKNLHPNTDVVLCPSSIPVSLLESKKYKTAFWSDATFGGLLDFYEDFSEFDRFTLKNGFELDNNAVKNCTLSIYASDWAAQSAIKHHKADPSRVKVVPYGANFECNRTHDDIKNIVSNRDKKTCQLLWVGINWERKGGQIALNIANEMNKMGQPTELIVIGCSPEIDLVKYPFVKILGYISKKTEEGQMQLESYFANSHFFIFPTKAEAYGIVLPESCSYGLPCLTSDQGGVTTIIKNDINGKTYNLNTPAAEMAAFLLESFTNKTRYEDLALSTFNEYKTRLNWEVATKTVKKLLDDC